MGEYNLIPKTIFFVFNGAMYTLKIFPSVLF